jgi:alpha-L-rhamnosidase
MSAFFHNWVQTMQDIQLAGHGDLPSFVPADPSSGAAAPTWAAIAVSVPWELWRRTGDTSILALGLNTSKLLIDFWQQHLDKDGLITLSQFGDWAESPRAGKAHDWSTGDECPLMLVEHATYIEGLDRGADLADAAGDTAQADTWRRQASDARGAVEARWWNESIKCYAQSCDSQSAQALPFVLNVTSAEHRAQAIAALVGSVTSWNTSYIAGIVGVRFMQEALTMAGRGDLALQLVGRNSDACTGSVSCTFSQWLERGPGTLWEQWDYTQMWTGASANHIMFGGGPGIFIHHAGGLPQFERFVSAIPSVGVVFALDGPIAAELGGADLYVEAAQGEAALRWRRTVDRGRPCVAVTIAGPLLADNRPSWELNVAAELLGQRHGVDVDSVNLTGTDDVTTTATQQDGDTLTMRPIHGSFHDFKVCG